MKLEKISENQIRCTLTRQDLEERDIKLSELAYGSTKTRALFQDMMNEAGRTLGFEVDGEPLMIEAVPMNAERIILIITKVESPDELDTRFSHFTQPSPASCTHAKQAQEPFSVSARDILDIFEHLTQEDSSDRATVEVQQSQLYVFPDLETVRRAALTLAGFYHGENTLYKDEQTGEYALFVRKGAHTPADFNKVCNILTEYGRQENASGGREALFEEQKKCLISKNALQTLAEL